MTGTLLEEFAPLRYCEPEELGTPVIMNSIISWIASFLAMTKKTRLPRRAPSVGWK